MNFLFIGRCVKDSIIDYDSGSKTENKPGGLFYSLLGALQVKRQTDEIYPITEISIETEPLFAAVLSKTKNDYLSINPFIPEVSLTIYREKERDESYTHFAEALTIPKVLPTPIHGVYINMITGFDITAEDIKELKHKFPVPFYMDIHSLARGLTADMKRPFHPISNVSDWLSSIDYVQCNEEELKMLGEGDISAIFEKLNSYGVTALIITKGAEGVHWYQKGASGHTHHAEKALTILQKTSVGCGDIFGSVCFMNLMHGSSVADSIKSGIVHAGNHAAGNNII